MHFDFEEQRFCSVLNYNCVNHKMKHYKFWVVLEVQVAPTDYEAIDWAKNWLVQDIKNSDHKYIERLMGPHSEENFTGAQPWN